MSRLSMLVFAFLLAVSPLEAQQIPDPVDHFGFNLGEDRKLADWAQLMSWYELIAQRSDRVTLDTLGETTLGAPFLMLTVTSPENHARLEDLHAIQLKLADPRLISGQAELEELLSTGKTVSLVTEGIHATEVKPPAAAARVPVAIVSLYSYPGSRR